MGDCVSCPSWASSVQSLVCTPQATTDGAGIRVSSRMSKIKETTGEQMHEVQGAACGDKLKSFFLSFDAMIELQLSMTGNSWTSLLLWGRVTVNEETNKRCKIRGQQGHRRRIKQEGGRGRGAPALDGVVKDLGGGRRPAARITGKGV